jgi:anaerobic selenocysteine-containing dehydrogenase
MIAHVEDGKVTRLTGNPDFHLTRGFLCRKARGFLKRVFSSERILQPMRRTGTTWRKVSWQEALDLLADKIGAAYARQGPLSVLYFRDSGSIAVLKRMNDRLFNLLGGATFTSGTLCGGAGIAGQTCDFGYRTAHDPEDLLNSHLIILWGRNPAVTNLHLMPILKQAQRSGSMVVLIDPVATKTAALVDRHLKIAPGSDALLATGITKVLLEEGCGSADFIKRCTSGFTRFLKAISAVDFDTIAGETGIGQNEIRDVAMLFSTNGPAAIVGGWGVQRHRNGAVTYRYLDALAAVAGSLGIRGGGVSHGMDELRWFDLDADLYRAPGQRRFIPKPQAGKGILSAIDPPIEVAIVTGANPVSQCPNTGLVKKAFESIPFLAVSDMFMTDTAALSDLVLPSTHFLQEQDVVGSYWHNHVMPVNPAQPRLGEEKPDLEVMHLLAERLGVGDDFPGRPEFYLDKVTAPLRAEGVSLEDLMRGPYRPKAAVDVPFGDGSFRTPSGRFEFVDVPPVTPGGSPDYPYWLLSPHPAGSIHSQLADVAGSKVPEALVSAATARLHRLADGDTVSVATPNGSLRCRTVISDRVRDDTVLVYEGGWDRLGGTVNRLTSDTLSDGGNSATYYDVKCSLTKAS